MELSYIAAYMWELVQKYGINPKDLLGNGDIYYMNGNDGTDFDFSANNMTCEFMMFWKKNAVGAIKLNQRGDELVAFVYDQDDPWNRDKVHEEKQKAKDDLYDVCCALYGTFDVNGIYDSVVENWKMDDYVYIDNEEDDEEDPYESAYDEEEDEEFDDNW